MGVYIPNMSKPKECKDCQWHLDFYIEDEKVGGLCTITEKDDKENTCPLIEIPTPHGRLIDGDKLRKGFSRTESGYCGYWEFCDKPEDMQFLIDDAPTILEAEE